MKTNFFFTGILLAALCLFGSCEPSTNEPSSNNGGNGSHDTGSAPGKFFKNYSAAVRLVNDL